MLVLSFKPQRGEKHIKHIFGGAPEAATKGATSHTASGGGATERIRIPLPDWRGGNTPGGGGGGATSSGDVGGRSHRAILFIKKVICPKRFL